MAKFYKILILIILLSATVFSNNKITDLYELYLKPFYQIGQIDSMYNAIYQVLIKEYQLTDTSLIIVCPGFKPQLALPEKHNVYYGLLNDLRYLNHFSINSNNAIMFEFIESQMDSVNYNFLVNAYRKLYKNEKYVFWEKTTLFFELHSAIVKKYLKYKKSRKLKVRTLDLNEL
jgi:hypothetical protein